jgi:hypothetical protein
MQDTLEPSLGTSAAYRYPISLAGRFMSFITPTDAIYGSGPEAAGGA